VPASHCSSKEEGQELITPQQAGAQSHPPPKVPVWIAGSACDNVAGAPGAWQCAAPAVAGAVGHNGGTVQHEAGSMHSLSNGVCTTSATPGTSTYMAEFHSSLSEKLKVSPLANIPLSCGYHGSIAFSLFLL
jgi:hypothetical protein